MPRSVLAAMMSGYVNAIKERSEYHSPIDNEEQSPSNEPPAQSEDQQDNDHSPFGI